MSDMVKLQKRLCHVSDEAPVEILARGPEAMSAYHIACQRGTKPVFRTRLMLVGQDGVGKTSLKNALTGQGYVSMFFVHLVFFVPVSHSLQVPIVLTVMRKSIWLPKSFVMDYFQTYTLAAFFIAVLDMLCS